MEGKDIGLAIAGALLGVIFTVVLQDAVEQLLGNISGRFQRKKGSRNLRGAWTILYATDDGTQDQTIELHQFRHKVWGNTSSVPYEYRVKAELHGDILVGQWYDVSKATTHEGTVLLRVKGFGKKLEGKYLGFDEDSNANEGDVIWERKDA